jgi:hypothetical protein
MSWVQVGLFLLGCAGGAVVILGPDRRWRLGGLAGTFAVQACTLWLAGAPVAAATRLIAGWIACGVLGLTLRQEERWEPAGARGGEGFRILSVLLVGAAAGGLGATAWESIAQISWPQAALSGVWLGVGLLGLGLASDAFDAGTSLLVCMAGFEAVYSVMETSLAILALLAALQIGMALVVAYMLDAAERARGEAG